MKIYFELYKSLISPRLTFPPFKTPIEMTSLLAINVMYPYPQILPQTKKNKRKRDQ